MTARACAIALILAGCTSAARPNSIDSVDIANFQRQSREIVQRERECEKAVLTRAQDPPAPVAPGSSTAKAQPLEPVTVQNVAQCREQATQENERLAARQRAEYERQAREERDRSSLMAILTTSLQH
ncbi:MAG TPA: hypothetical protein VMF50_07340 [Candidatus Binataceae bacterium]|nr:hypothetical protein [Candidatus Binataceae bacterium]